MRVFKTKIHLRSILLAHNVKLYNVTKSPLKCFILLARSIMGPDLELVVLEMTVEDQMERVRARARGSEQAVEILKVRFWF